MVAMRHRRPLLTTLQYWGSTTLLFSYTYPGLQALRPSFGYLTLRDTRVHFRAFQLSSYICTVAGIILLRHLIPHRAWNSLLRPSNKQVANISPQACCRPHLNWQSLTPLMTSHNCQRFALLLNTPTSVFYSSLTSLGVPSAITTAIRGRDFC